MYKKNTMRCLLNTLSGPFFSILCLLATCTVSRNEGNHGQRSGAFFNIFTAGWKQGKKEENTIESEIKETLGSLKFHNGVKEHCSETSLQAQSVKNYGSPAQPRSWPPLSRIFRVLLKMKNNNWYIQHKLHAFQGQSGGWCLEACLVKLPEPCDLHVSEFIACLVTYTHFMSTVHAVHFHSTHSGCKSFRPMCLHQAMLCEYKRAYLGPYPPITSHRKHGRKDIHHHYSYHLLLHNAGGSPSEWICESEGVGSVFTLDACFS